MLLVPADVLHLRRPDEHFAEEMAAARDAGLNVALIDHDALVNGRTEQAVSRVQGGGEAMYRGWMVSAERYAALTAVLAERGITLRTTAGQYRCAHELPGWYGALADVTPESVWTVGDDIAYGVTALRIEAMRSRFAEWEDIITS